MIGAAEIAEITALLTRTRAELSAEVPSVLAVESALERLDVMLVTWLVMLAPAT
jgi:hypothetical protein